MIKANELRIGNLIFLFTKQEIFEVVSMTKNTISSDSYCREHSEFEGIPITEEWLIKFGFLKQKNEQYITGTEFIYLIGDKTKLASCPKLGGGLCVLCTCRGNYFANNLEYVHELQNLYFAIKGVELFFSTEP